MASLLAFGTIMSKAVLNHKLASRILESLPHDGDQRHTPNVVKGCVRSINYLCRGYRRRCLSPGQDQQRKRRGELPRWSGAIPDDAAVPLAAGRKRRG